MAPKSKNVVLPIVLISIGIIVAVVLIVLAFSLGKTLGIRSAQNGNTFIDETLDEEPNETIVIEDSEEEFVVSIYYLRDLLKPASDLIISKYYYTDADISDDYIDIKGFRIPGTTTKTVFTYDGVISLGFDISDVSYDIDTEKKEITVSLPQISILANEIDFDSFQYFDVSKSILNPTEMEETTELLAALKNKTSERVLGNEALMEQARINAQTVIEELLKSSSYLKDYAITFK